MTMADADGDGKKELLVGSDDFEVKASMLRQVQRALLRPASLSQYSSARRESTTIELSRRNSGRAIACSGFDEAISCGI